MDLSRPVDGGIARFRLVQIENALTLHPSKKINREET